MAPRHEIVEKKDSGISALGVIAPPPIHITTPTFDGSLAMLFRCVHDHKVQLLDVPLFPICEAYFLYLLNIGVQDLDEAAAALGALAYLIERKAWALLPVADPEPEMEDPMELPSPSTYEYHLAIDSLRVWHEERAQCFFRSSEVGPNPYELPFELGDIGAEDLSRAFARLLQRAQPEEVKSLSRPRRALSEQMVVVMQSISGAWRSLEQMVPEPFTRHEAVYWFLALLELIRLGQVAVRVKSGDVQFAKSARRTN